MRRLMMLVCLFGMMSVIGCCHDTCDSCRDICTSCNQAQRLTPSAPAAAPAPIKVETPAR